MQIKPLTPAKLKEAMQLLNKAFPYESMSLAASLFPDRLLYKITFLVARVTQLNYWVAIDETSQKVIGTTGLYCYKKDETEAYWLAMFCVDPAFRGQGIGKKLLNFSIDKARADGKKFLRLYTSNAPNEAAAQILYEKCGFVITGEKKIWGLPYKKIYRELQLSDV
jgi:ribosomal protein S18 acetylase RimI-like enzyme